MSVSFSADASAYSRTMALGTQTQISMCGWFNITTDRNTNAVPLGVFNGSNTDYICMGTFTDGTTWRAFDEGAQSTSGQNMTVGTWYFAALSVNGVNGNLWSRAANSTTYTNVTWSTFSANTNANTLRIGRHDATGLFWAGKIAAVKLWIGATLTLADFQQESMQFMPTRFLNLRAWYPFLGTQTEDWSGNGSTLTAGTATSDSDNPPIQWDGGVHTIFIPANTVTPKSLNDTASSSEALAASVTVPLADTGSSSESLSVTVTTPLVDSASALESLAISATAVLNDSATSTESLTANVTAALADAGISSEVLSANTILALTDTGSSSESLTSARPVAVSDTASSTESLVISVSTTTTESASSTEVLAISATTPLADIGSSAESLSASVLASLTDSASASDSLSVTVSVPLSEGASATEQLGVSAQVPLGDVGSGSESFLQGAFKTLTDSGSAQDSLSVSVALSLADGASAAESLGALVLVALTEAGTAQEALANNGNAPTVGYMQIPSLTGPEMIRAFREGTTAIGDRGPGSKAETNFRTSQQIKRGNRESSRMSGGRRQGPSIGGS